MVADVDGVVAVEDREEDDDTMRNDHLCYDDVPLRPKKMLSIAAMTVALYEIALVLLYGRQGGAALVISSWNVPHTRH
jgi:hypothetical protein